MSVMQAAKPVTTSVQLPQAVAENVLTLLCLNAEHGKLVSRLVKPQDFDDEVYRTFATRALEYWRTEKRPPGKVHTGDLVSEILSDPNNRRRGRFREVLNGMLLADYEGINAAYVLQQVETLQRLAAYRRATLQTADLLEAKGQFAFKEVNNVWSDVFRSSTLEPNEPLYRLGSSLATFLAELDEEPDREFNTGIPELDRCGIVPMRGTLMVMLAPTSAGKSWFLIHMAKQGMLAKRNVLYVTLELSRHQVSKRILQSFACGAFDEDHLAVTVSDLVLENDRLIGFNDCELTAKFHMKDRQARRKALREYVIGEDRVGRLDRLVIEEFPMRGLTVTELGARLEQLAHRGFTPDLLCLDYVGVLNTGSGENHRIELGRTVEGLRGLASERNIAVVTAAQLNRQGQEAKAVKGTHVAEDLSIIQTADTILTLSRSEKEMQRGLARLWVEKGRNAIDRFEVLLSQNLDHGRFVRKSTRLPSNYADLIAGLPDRR